MANNLTRSNSQFLRWGNAEQIPLFVQTESGNNSSNHLYVTEIIFRLLNQKHLKLF